MNWYTTNPAGPDSESAAHGTQGLGGGVDAALEYRVASCVGFGIGYVPTGLHAEIHSTSTSRPGQST